MQCDVPLKTERTLIKANAENCWAPSITSKSGAPEEALVTLIGRHSERKIRDRFSKAYRNMCLSSSSLLCHRLNKFCMSTEWLLCTHKQQQKNWWTQFGILCPAWTIKHMLKCTVHLQDRRRMQRSRKQWHRQFRCPEAKGTPVPWGVKLHKLPSSASVHTWVKRQVSEDTRDTSLLVISYWTHIRHKWMTQTFVTFI